jgi:hypothetical protein
MAWVHRASGRYYYRSVRYGSRTTKTYHGTGLLGELAAALDAEEHAEHQAKADAWLKARKDMEALDEQFTAWWDASSTLLTALLTAAGYYQHHRGEWRKRARRSPAPQAD